MKRVLLSLALLLTLGAGCADAAWAHVQSTSTAAAASKAFLSNIGASHLLIATAFFGSAGTWSSISDTLGNSWVQLGTEDTNAANGAKTRVYYVVSSNGAGADTVTYTVTGSPAFKELLISEYSGIDTTTAIDAGIIQDFASGYNPSVTAGAANELNYTVCISSTSCGCPSGYTSRTAPDGAACDKVSVSGVNQPVFTGGGAQTDALVIFKLAGAGAPACTDSHMLGVWRCDEERR